MLSRSVTAGLALAVCLAGIAAWFVFHNVPSDHGRPGERFLLQTDTGDFDTVILHTSAGEFSCQKLQDVWWITSPVSARADGERIQRLLDALVTARIEDTITASEQRMRQVTNRDFGLVEPQARIFMKGETVAPVELRLGKMASNGDYIYVGITGMTDIWMTDAQLLEVLPMGIGETRDRALLPYPMKRLVRFELRSSGAPLIAMEKEADGTWRIRQPDCCLASPAAVDALLSYVENTRITSFVHTVDYDENKSLSSEDLSITYGCTPEETELLARFWFPRSRTSFEFYEFRVGKAHPLLEDQVYLLSAEEGLVVTVPDSFPHSLRVNLDDLRERRLWNIESREVKRLEYKSDSSYVAIERDEAEGWLITNPIKAPADQDACEVVVKALAELTDISTVQAEKVQQHDFSVELTRQNSSLAVTGLVSRIEEDGELFYDWQILPSTVLRRVPADSLSHEFGDPLFPASLREPVLLRIPKEELAAVSYQWGTQTVFQVYCNRENGWDLPGQVDSNDIARVIGMAAEFEAERVESLTPTSLEPFGLLDPLFAITFRDVSTNNNIRIVTLGKKTASGGRFAAVKGQDSVFGLSTETVQKLEKPLHSLGLLE